MKQLLRNGLISGLAGGLALALVLLVVGERSLGEAIRLEEARSESQAHVDGADDHGREETFSRSTQTAGGAFGSLLYGAVLGVVFAVVFGALRHRIAAQTELRRSVVLAACGWLGVVAVPFLLYPPVPPGASDPTDVGGRTAAYVMAILWGILAVAVARAAARGVERRGLPEALGHAAAIACFTTLVVLATLVLPPRPSANTLPADLVWDFRLASLAGTTSCWLVLGLVFGALRSGTRQREEELARA